MTVYAGSFASVWMDMGAACLTLILHLDNNINTTFSTLRYTVVISIVFLTLTDVRDSVAALEKNIPLVSLQDYR